MSKDTHRVQRQPGLDHRAFRLVKNYKRFLSILTAITYLALNTVTTPATWGLTFTNTYPYETAKAWDAINFEWWMDENGNKRFDDGELSSPLGYYYRNCTDGAAYYVHEHLDKTLPNDLGNAKTWDDNYLSGSILKKGDANTIEPGDIAQSDDGYWGHVGFVTDVVKDGSGTIVKIRIAEMNQSGTGTFTHDWYDSKNADNRFTRAYDKDWDHFIDVNGTGIGLRPTETSTIPWTLETFEGDSASVTGHNATTGQTPTGIEFNGKFYIFSYDQTSGNLRYGKSAATGWEYGILDGAGGSNGRVNADVGRTPAAVVWSNTLQLFYYASDGQDLRHAWTSNGTTWSFEALDNGPTPRGMTPTVTTYATSLQVFYGEGPGNLRHAFTTPTQGWTFETLEGDAGSITRYNGDTGHDPTAVVLGTSLHLFSYEAGGKNLRHTWTTSGQPWRSEFFDGTSSVCGLEGEIGSNPTAAAYNNTLQVFYYDNSRGNLRHAWADGTGWHCETMEGDSAAALGYNSNVGAMPTAAVYGDSLQVFAYEPEWEALRHYWTSPTQGWRSENLDGLGGNPAGRLDQKLGLDPKIATFGSKLQLLYYDHTSGNLRRAATN